MSRGTYLNKRRYQFPEGKRSSGVLLPPSLRKSLLKTTWKGVEVPQQLIILEHDEGGAKMEGRVSECVWDPERSNKETLKE